MLFTAISDSPDICFLHLLPSLGIYYSNINDGGIMMYFENIRPEDIFRKRRNGTGMLIDLRSVQDYQNGHIPGAVCIPYEQLEARIPELRSWVI